MSMPALLQRLHACNLEGDVVGAVDELGLSLDDFGYVWYACMACMACVWRACITGGCFRHGAVSFASEFGGKHQAGAVDRDPLWSDFRLSVDSLVIAFSARRVEFSPPSLKRVVYRSGARSVDKEDIGVRGL
jgi:hypothetical protein